MEEKYPVIRNIVIDGDLGLAEIINAVKVVWPECCDKSHPMTSQTIYMSQSVKDDWGKPYPEIEEGKDLSMLQLARIPFGDEWVWIVSFHSCDSKHFVPIVSAISDKCQRK